MLVNGFPFAVRFRFVVFRPFIDEIIVGRIRGSSADGVKGIIIMAYKSYEIRNSNT